MQICVDAIKKFKRYLNINNGKTLRNHLIFKLLTLDSLKKSDACIRLSHMTQNYFIIAIINT